MPTPSSLNVDIDALFAQTLRNWRGQLVDNVFSDNKVTAFLMEDDDGYRRDDDGGDRISETLMYGENTTVGWYSGYDPIDDSPQDNVGEAYFQWRQLAGSLTISGEEQEKNKGRSQILSMLNSKRKNLEMSIKSNLNEALLNKFDNGPSSDRIQPLPFIVPKDPTASAYNPLGAIDGSASENDFWRSQSISSSTGGTATYHQLNKEASQLYRVCALGTGGVPNVGICDHNTWGNIEQSMDERKRLDNEEVTAKYGFENLRFKQASLLFDEKVPDVQNESPYDGSQLNKGTLFFLNTDFLTLVVNPNREFEPTDFKKPANQDAKIAQVLWMGALVTSNRRKHGVLYNVNLDLSPA